MQRVSALRCAFAALTLHAPFACGLYKGSLGETKLDDVGRQVKAVWANYKSIWLGGPVRTGAGRSTIYRRLLHSSAFERVLFQNAAIIGNVQREALIALSVLGSLVLAVGGAIAWMLIYVGIHAPERIVRPEGALMAVSPDGLRTLNAMHALPKDCTEANMRSARVTEVVTLCSVPQPPLKGENRAGLVYLLPGTKAVATDRKFVLPGGRSVVPY